MKVKRKIIVNTKTFEVGDTIKFRLADGKKVKAEAVRKTPEGMLFITADCIGSEQQMYKNLRGMKDMKLCYADSDLRRYLREELLPLFPEEIRSRMAGMRIGGTDSFDFLRIPTEKEIFGENLYGRDEDGAERFKGMKNQRNRIALGYSGGKKDLQGYWLQNLHERYVSVFAHAGCRGDDGYGSASNSYGVRLVFLLA